MRRYTSCVVIIVTVVIIQLIVNRTIKNEIETKTHLRKESIGSLDYINATTMHADFDKLGWDMWLQRDHLQSGQNDRIRRATDEQIKIYDYDSCYQIAKIQGLGGIYLTDGSYCSCPDFQKRGLPCKHMYWLCHQLNSGEQLCEKNTKLAGLKIGMAGRFRVNIRKEISQAGGEITENPYIGTDAIVVGKSPSEKKLNKSDEYHIRVFTDDELFSLFDNITNNPIDSEP